MIWILAWLLNRAITLVQEPASSPSRSPLMLNLVTSSPGERFSTRAPCWVIRPDRLEPAFGLKLTIFHPEGGV
jgi:hypothetical protein